MTAMINIKIPKAAVKPNQTPEDSKVPGWFKKLEETVSRIEKKLRCYQKVTQKSAAKRSVSNEKMIYNNCGGHGHRSKECPSKQWVYHMETRSNVKV